MDDHAKSVLILWSPLQYERASTSHDQTGRTRARRHVFQTMLWKMPARYTRLEHVAGRRQKILEIVERDAMINE